MIVQAFEPGAVLRVDLDGQWHTYARMLARRSRIAFLDRRAGAPVTDMHDIVGSDVLFVLDVHETAYETGRWRKVGLVPLEQSPLPVPDRFLQSLGSDQFRIMDADGDVRPATLAECEGLERVAAWSPEQAEARLRDHYAGRPNPDVERMKARPGRQFGE